MKSRISIKGVLIMTILLIASALFINMSFAVDTAKISVETANLRAEPDVNSTILELISLNEEVQIVEKQDEWYKVKYEGITGYLREDLLSVSNKDEQETAISEEQEEIEQEVSTVENSNSENENISVEDDNSENTETIKQVKYKMAEDVNLKLIPTINSTEINKIAQNEEIQIVERINKWVCVKTTTCQGWISENKILEVEVGDVTTEETIVDENIEEKDETLDTEIEETDNVTEVDSGEEKIIKTQYINSTSVNVREEPSTDANKVTTLSLNTEVDVYSEENGWSKIKVNGVEGYISSSLLSDSRQETSRAQDTARVSKTETSDSNIESTSESSTENTSNSTSNQTITGATIAEYAKSYIGSSYVYGGTTPAGFDCSGFTQYVYKQFGISLNRTAAAQYSNGTAVSKSDLQVGDLIMFGLSGINHVGIYIGNGLMVHAANSTRGVTTDTINSGYYCNNYVGARRVI